jgi:preprotein translocase subunit SecF
VLRGIQFLPSTPKIPFMRYRRAYFAFTIAITLLSLGSIAVQGFNYGIDFRGGILIEARFPQPADVAGLRSAISGLNLGDASLQEFGGPREVLIRVQRQAGGEKEQQAAVERIKGALGAGVEYRRTEFVGPQVSAELFRDGIYATVAALFAIAVYVWFRFEWQFGVCALLSLIHDVVSTLGLFSLFGLEFNLTIVAAVLTVAGYSINDTVVIFDRVRENLRKYKAMPIVELFDRSNNETLSRTLITGVSTLLVLVALYFLGGEVLRGFSIALIWGILIGTYSSVCLAVPLLLYFDVSRLPGKARVGGEEAAKGSP